MILVTGGAGFIGSHLVNALNRTTPEPIAVCDYFENVQWRYLRTSEVHDFVHPGELTRFLAVNGQQISHVFHLGAVSSTETIDSAAVIERNFIASCQLWDWCADSETAIVYASSAATYGDGSNGFSDECSPEYLAGLRPLNAYAWSKHLFDRRVARALASGTRRPPVSLGLKFFNVFGPHEAHKGRGRSMVRQAYDQLLASNVVSLYRSTNPERADGAQRRDFIWIDDAVATLLWCYRLEGFSGLLNVGTGVSRSFNDVATCVARSLGVPERITYKDMPDSLRAAYQNMTCAEMQRARYLGFGHEFLSLEVGVDRYVRWLRKETENGC